MFIRFQMATSEVPPGWQVTTADEARKRLHDEVDRFCDLIEASAIVKHKREQRKDARDRGVTFGGMN